MLGCAGPCRAVRSCAARSWAVLCCAVLKLSELFTLSVSLFRARALSPSLSLSLAVRLRSVRQLGRRRDPPVLEAKHQHALALLLVQVVLRVHTLQEKQRVLRIVDGQGALTAGPGAFLRVGGEGGGKAFYHCALAIAWRVILEKYDKRNSNPRCCIHTTTAIAFFFGKISLL